MSKIEVEEVKSRVRGMGGVEVANALATLALVEATDRQTAVIAEQNEHKRRAEALLVGAKVLMQNNNAHLQAMEHMFKMVGGLLNAAEQIPGFSKAPEGVRAAFDAAKRFTKAGGQDFGPLFGRVLSQKAYDALPDADKAKVDEQLAELVTFLQAQVGR